VTAPIPEPLREALAGRYALEEVIGRGGMATVYVAQDLKHGRRVAVKVLRPELAASIGTDRFLKEIEIAARLTHPHVVPLHDSGEAGGFLYYVMPFIEGGSLRALLVRERRLSRPRALSIATAVGAALGYAHRMGVLHRDVKPENILFADGHPVVTDFGIARAVSRAGGQHLTRTGFSLGTPGYMSPEQAAGNQEVDERTDVYGLAATCYEMLVGESPGFWLSDDAVRLGRFVDLPAEHRYWLDRLSGSLESALVRGLAIRPADRYPTAGQFVKALRESARSRRKYSDTEVQAIVREASEQEAADAGTEQGLTIGTVEQIAAQVGITPERVRAAARAIERRPEPSPGSWIAGAPTSLRFERVIDGEVSDREYALMVDDIRTTLGEVGNVSTLGQTLAWSTSPSAQGVGRKVQVIVTPRGGRTRIVVEEHLGQLAGGLFGGIMGGVGGGGGGAALGIGMGALQAPVAALVTTGLIVLGSYGLARTIYRRTARQRERQLRELVERLATQVAQTIGGAARADTDRPWETVD
jgi:serine/threonine protein kinase